MTTSIPLIWACIEHTRVAYTVDLLHYAFFRRDDFKMNVNLIYRIVGGDVHCKSDSLI